MAAKRLLYLLIVIEILMMTTCMPLSTPPSEKPQESSVEQVWSAAAEEPISAASGIVVDQQGNVYVFE